MKAQTRTLVSGALLVLAVSALIPFNGALASPTTATFSGFASVHVVVRILGTGQIVTVSFSSVPFTVITTSGGPGVGTIRLIVPKFGMNQGPDPVGFGMISVTATRTSGGGTLHNMVTGYMSQEGFGVNMLGGQFQCQNTGRSAGVVDAFMSGMFGTPVDTIQMDLHGAVLAGSLSVS